ncbi:MAG: AraC family transcriptional regulator ligand-binding domain-containing protein [Moraxellaceae bacterium]|nr:AraC family transcriptional regulator ligand-binding domain-containing protein [Moraxellaceae bacterium]
MATVIRVTGAWTQLLGDWLDAELLPAPELRAALARWAAEDNVPVPVWRDLLERGVALRPQLLVPGLSIGALVQPRHVGVLGYVALASATLGEAMQAYLRYERLFYGAELAEVLMEEGEVELRWRRDAGAGLGPLGDDVAIAALVTFLRRQVEDAPAPTLVGFAGPWPRQKERAVYEAFFGSEVVFDGSHTRLRFPVEYLGLTNPHRDPGLRDLMDRQAEALLAALPDSSPFDRSLQQLLPRLLQDGSATLPRAARELHLSPRSLQRRLDARGLAWQQLLNDTREQLARQYLSDRALSIGDIALLLGFSEQSAFTRAFSRWTGETPARWRRAQTGATP